MSAVTLPRTLVLKLLHQAQLGMGAGFISRHADGSYTLGTADTAPFAFYRIAPQAVLEATDLDRCRGLTSLVLSVAVETKGVLELRGWRIGARGAEPVELILAEEDRVPT